MGIASGAWKLTKGTIAFPVKHPVIFTAVVGTVATGVTMATTGLPLGQSFGAVAGNVTSGSLNAVSEFVPFAWDSAVEAAPGAWDSFAEWTTGVWDAAANDATFDLAA